MLSNVHGLTRAQNLGGPKVFASQARADRLAVLDDSKQARSPGEDSNNYGGLSVTAHAIEGLAAKWTLLIPGCLFRVEGDQRPKPLFVYAHPAGMVYARVEGLAPDGETVVLSAQEHGLFKDGRSHPRKEPLAKRSSIT